MHNPGDIAISAYPLPNGKKVLVLQILPILIVVSYKSLSPVHSTVLPGRQLLEAIT